MSVDGISSPISVPAPRRLWTDAQWERLRKGAGNTDWVATVAGDTLVLSDGDTGDNIYSARFRRDLAGWKIVSAEVETDEDVHLADTPERESERLQSVIEQLAG